MENHQVTVHIPIIKKYSVTRHKFRNSIYRGDCSGLAIWYYSHMDASSDNIIIHVYGDYHQTYPNEPHLSVSYETDNHTSQRYHMSIDSYGYYYIQPLLSSIKKVRRKSRKSRKRHGKSKSRSRF